MLGVSSSRARGGLTAEAVDGAGFTVFRRCGRTPGELSLVHGFAPVRITNVALTLGWQPRIDLVLVPQVSTKRLTSPHRHR
jgi:hypothetical protein